MLRMILWSLMTGVLVGCSAVGGGTDGPSSALDPPEDDRLPPATDQAPPAAQVQLPDLGPAPELMNAVWLNVDAPLRLAELRGQVVLLEMWAFG